MDQDRFSLGRHEDSPCPKCERERRCIGHDVTEVIDLIPAEVMVRREG